MVLFLKKGLFRPNYEVFLAKKSENFQKLEKGNYDEAAVVFEKKRFHLVKSLLEKTGSRKKAPGGRPSRLI